MCWHDVSGVTGTAMDIRGSSSSSSNSRGRGVEETARQAPQATALLPHARAAVMGRHAQATAYRGALAALSGQVRAFPLPGFLAASF
mmetsp:Transcript_38755/g.115253  ORF Transcript_38755/g.115253 Transcript_38755/m.115253 type:complete len:87 (-) Transcript_38755:170-430(-)